MPRISGHPSSSHPSSSYPSGRPDPRRPSSGVYPESGGAFQQMVGGGSTPSVPPNRSSSSGSPASQVPLSNVYHPNSVYPESAGRYGEAMGGGAAFSGQSTQTGLFNERRDRLAQSMDPSLPLGYRQSIATDQLTRGGRMSAQQAESQMYPGSMPPVVPSSAFAASAHGPANMGQSTSAPSAGGYPSSTGGYPPSAGGASSSSMGAGSYPPSNGYTPSGSYPPSGGGASSSSSSGLPQQVLQDAGFMDPMSYGYQGFRR